MKKFTTAFTLAVLVLASMYSTGYADKALAEKYGIGEPAFVFRYYEKIDTYTLGQLDSDEIIYMDKKEGGLDVDGVIDEIRKFLSGE